ncbi:PIPO [Stylosanthes mosaic-associated virus 1]|nr:PIPO [Stylosanthes mosaic-associated virus 1]
MARSVINTIIYECCKKFHRAQTRTRSNLTNAEKIMLVWGKQCNSKILTASPHRIAKLHVSCEKSHIQRCIWRNLAVNQGTGEF